MKSMRERMSNGDPNVVITKGGGGGITDEDRELVRRMDEIEANSLAQIKQERSIKQQKPPAKASSH
jgi:hypothetical protein